MEAHCRLGVAYEKSGWTQKAIAQYEKFLDIWNNADAKERLTKLKTQS